MFNLIPWKKRNDGGTVSVHRSEPSRQELSDFVSRFHDDFGPLMSRFFEDRWFGRRGLPSLWDQRFGWNWDVGWEDHDKEYVFHAKLPGFEPKDFDVKVSGNRLTIRAERKDEQEGKGGHSYRYGSFSRTFSLPRGVDEDQIDARYHSGVLEVRLPKTEEALGKPIPVSAN